MPTLKRIKGQRELPLGRAVSSRTPGGPESIPSDAGSLNYEQGISQGVRNLHSEVVL